MDWKDGDAEDRRERQELEHTRVPMKLDECNSQRLLEKPDLEEEEAHDLQLMGGKRYWDLKYVKWMR